MTRKEIATSFRQLAGTGRVQKAYNKFVSIDFIHHNQYFQGNRDGLKKAMKQAHQTIAIEVKYSYEDGVL